jgi:hypothetical protein
MYNRYIKKLFNQKTHIPMKKLCINSLLTLVALLPMISVSAQDGISLTAPRPNLVVTSVVTDKTTYVLGETVNCKVTFKNIGAAKAIGTLDDAAKGYMLDLVLSIDASAPIVFAAVPAPYEFQEDMLVIGGRHSNTPTLAPGMQQTFALSFPLPKVMVKPCQLGYVALGGVIDPGKKIAESNEADNTNFARFKIICEGPTAPRPDLVITYMALASPVGGPGLAFSDMKVEVKNIGGAPAIGTDSDPANGYMVDIITSSNTAAPMAYAPLAVAGQFPEDKLVIGGRISNTKTLAPGASYIYYLSGLKLPMVDLHNYCGRGFYLGGIADPGLKIGEISETNNQYFIDFKVDCKNYTVAK